MNISDSLVNTRLLLAIRNHDYALIKELVNNGADINCKNKNGKTPLDILTETSCTAPQAPYHPVYNEFNAFVREEIALLPSSAQLFIKSPQFMIEPWCFRGFVLEYDRQAKNRRLWPYVPVNDDFNQIQEELKQDYFFLVCMTLPDYGAYTHKSSVPTLDEYVTSELVYEQIDTDDVHRKFKNSLDETNRRRIKLYAFLRWA